MARFSAIQSGTRARTSAELTFVGQSAPTRVDLRVLNTAEEGDARAGALAFALKNGAKDPSDGDPLYDLGRWAYTCLFACIDADSPKDAPEPFFESIDQILSSGVVLPDHLAYLFEIQSDWQDQNSPYASALSDGEVLRRATLIVAGERLPFLELRPGLRWSFVHTMAVQLVTLRVLKSRFGSLSSETTSDESPETPPGETE